MQTLRVQSAEGTARVELEQAAPATALYEAVREAMGVSAPFVLHRDRGHRQPLPAGPARLLDLGLRHGDMLFLSPLGDEPRASQVGPCVLFLIRDGGGTPVLRMKIRVECNCSAQEDIISNSLLPYHMTILPDVC